MVVSLLELLVGLVGFLLAVNLWVSLWLGWREARRWSVSEERWVAFLRHWRADHDRVSLALSSLERSAVQQLEFFRSSALVGVPRERFAVPVESPAVRFSPSPRDGEVFLTQESPAFESWRDVVEARKARESKEVVDA